MFGRVVFEHRVQVKGEDDMGHKYSGADHNERWNEKKGGVKSFRIRYTAKRARQFLIDNIAQIHNVGDWAKQFGYSQNWMGQCIKQHYGMLSKEMLREVRYERIVYVIQKHPDALSDQVADLSSPHWNGKNLCNFLSKYYNVTFTELRFSLLKK